MATAGWSVASTTGRSSSSTALTTIPNSILVCFHEPKLALALPRKVVNVVGKKNNNGLMKLNICKMMMRRQNKTSTTGQTENTTTTADTMKDVADRTAKINQYSNDYNLSSSSVSRVEERLARKKRERNTYLFAAILSSLGISSLAVMAVYYRFSCQLEGGEIPVVEMFGTFALSVGAAVGMEFWARWAHRALWHASLWHMHESHHRRREGAFELNDVFAIINAVPAIALLAFGFFNRGLIPGLCFGAGLGITVFGMAYMFVHDGLVHRRFQVGPIAHVPYLRKVAAAHQLHHAEKFNGVPYGLFLGPQELEEVGGSEELEKEIKRRI